MYSQNKLDPKKKKNRKKAWKVHWSGCNSLGALSSLMKPQLGPGAAQGCSAPMELGEICTAQTALCVLLGRVINGSFFISIKKYKKHPHLK